MTILLILASVAIIAYFFVKRGADTNVQGKINPEAVALRRHALKSTEALVHEQFALLFAAAATTEDLSNPRIFSALEELDPDDQEKWIRKQLAQSLEAQGFGATFLRAKLARYVFELYRPYYVAEKLMYNMKVTPTSDVSANILRSAGQFLDQQFSKKGRADICSFLKRENTIMPLRQKDIVSYSKGLRGCE